MDFSILPYTSHELENANHPMNFRKSTIQSLRAALGQMGVGGDDSWGKHILNIFFRQSALKLQLHYEGYLRAKGVLPSLIKGDVQIKTMF